MQTATALAPHVYQDASSGRRILRLTNIPDGRAVHGYYDNCPWSPDGSQVAFTRMRSPEAGAGEICVVNADGSNVRVLATTRHVTPNDGAFAQWSADGSRIFFNDCEDGTLLARWVEVAGGRTGAAPGRIRMMAPTGNRYAWHSEFSLMSDEDIRTGKSEMGVFVRDLDANQTRRLATVADALALHPHRDSIRDWHLYIKHTKWSPDGQRLFFVFTNEARLANTYGETDPRVKDLYVVDADGSNLRFVGPFGNHPIWHPQGREILANCPWPGRNGNHLVLIHADTGARRIAAHSLPGVGHPSYAPDGTRLCVDQCGSQGPGTISVIDVPSDTAECLVRLNVRDHTHKGTHLHPSWSRDGKQLLFASDEDGSAQLRVVDATA